MQGSRERVKRQIKQRKSDTNSKVKPDSLSWEISNNGATNIGRKNDSKPKLEDIYPKRMWIQIILMSYRVRVEHFNQKVV